MTARVDVERSLESYNTLKQDLAVIIYEMEHCAGIEYSAVIEALTFERKMQDKVQESGPSDRTGSIAMNYRKIAESQHREHLRRLYRDFMTISEEIRWIDYCVAQLIDPMPEIIRASYFLRKTRAEICSEQAISQSTLTRLRNRALVELENMFSRKSALRVGKFLSDATVSG